MDPESFRHSKFIVIWACNSVSTNLHHWHVVKEAQKAGAKVVVIDAYRSRTAKEADWHIAPRPGTDGALAMALIHTLIAEDLVDRRVGTLSGGELQRVLLALALTPVPNILVLDEPMSGVDHSGREQFYELLSKLRREFDLAVLLVSHDLATLARFADRMVFLDHRIVCEGSPAEVLRDARVREAFSLHSLS